MCSLFGCAPQFAAWQGLPGYAYNGMYGPMQYTSQLLPDQQHSPFSNRDAAPHGGSGMGSNSLRPSQQTSAQQASSQQQQQQQQNSGEHRAAELQQHFHQLHAQQQHQTQQWHEQPQQWRLQTHSQQPGVPALSAQDQGSGGQSTTRGWVVEPAPPGVHHDDSGQRGTSNQIHQQSSQSRASGNAQSAQADQTQPWQDTPSGMDQSRNSTYSTVGATAHPSADAARSPGMLTGRDGIDASMRALGSLALSTGLDEPPVDSMDLAQLLAAQSFDDNNLLAHADAGDIGNGTDAGRKQ